jgi:hypothetical protein
MRIQSSAPRALLTWQSETSRLIPSSPHSHFPILFCSSDNRMVARIFVKFRSSQIPCEPGKKHKFVADAACSVLMGRDFDFKRDFLHSQGEAYSANALCHVLIDCEYLDTSHISGEKDISLYCYAVEDRTLQDGCMCVPRSLPVVSSFVDMQDRSLRKTHVHRGQIDVVPWGRHSS